MRQLFVVTLVTSICVSCSPKNTDIDIKTSIETKLKAKPDMSAVAVDVKNGIATIEGQCKDEACRLDCEAIAQQVKGVKTVINDLTVPGASLVRDTVQPIGAAPLVIVPEDPLINLVNTVADKFQGVKAAVADSIVTLTGEIKKTDLPKLMKELSALGPRKIEQKLTVVKHPKTKPLRYKKSPAKKKNKAMTKKRRRR